MIRNTDDVWSQHINKVKNCYWYRVMINQHMFCMLQ